METTDHVGIISILPAKYRPPRSPCYGSADNIFMVASTKWDMWSYVEEILLNQDDELITDDDIWIISWDATWDLDQVVEEWEAGYVDEHGEEATVEYTIWEMLEMVTEDVSYSSEWLGDPTLEANTEENIQRIAVDVTTSCTNDTMVVIYGLHVKNAVMLPFIEWRCDLYGGRFRKVV